MIYFNNTTFDDIRYGRVVVESSESSRIDVVVVVVIRRVVARRLRTTLMTVIAIIAASCCCSGCCCLFSGHLFHDGLLFLVILRRGWIRALERLGYRFGELFLLVYCRIVEHGRVVEI